MTELIIDEDQITTIWLTGRLRKNGYLAKGKVTNLTKKCFKTIFSTIYRLEVTYSADAIPTLPVKLLLKIPFPDNDAALNMGKEEIIIYNALSKGMYDPPVVRCFDSVFSENSKRSHLLLEDLSDSHFQTELPLPPSKRHCELCIETLAQFHAFWWNHTALGTEIGQPFDKSSLDKIVFQLRDALSDFIEFMGDRLSPDRRKAYEKAIASIPTFWERRLISDKQKNTLIHGDAHLWNFLHPKDAVNGRAYLIDLATTNRIRPPTNDLAYMMALQWFPERRAIMEEELLRHYHKALLLHGVKDYSWDDCRLDYRYSVITHLFTPVFQWHSKQIPAMVWWHNFERISEAYKDLDCHELL